MGLFSSDIAAVRKRDFEQIYDTYSRRIYGFALRISDGDTFLAEEIVQESCIRLWEHWEGLNDRQAALGYLFSTAKHIFLNYCEHEMVKYVYEEYVLQHDSELTGESESSQDARSLEAYLRQIVDNMPPVRQKVFMMSRYEHKSNKEIAATLGISEKTVEVHITLALRELRAHLSD
jgi:RNA polymerase sigma-70 factor (ECF subfamily)